MCHSLLRILPDTVSVRKNKTTYIYYYTIADIYTFYIYILLLYSKKQTNKTETQVMTCPCCAALHCCWAKT